MPVRARWDRTGTIVGMVLRRLTAVLPLAVLILLGTATPALAHAELTSSNPADGASLDSAPRQLELTFNAPVSPEEITVEGPQGTSWTVDQIAVEGATVTVPVRAVGPAGPYTISYRALSEDGDVVAGTVRFTMTTAATPAPAATPGADRPAPPSSTGSSAAWVWIVGAIAVVALLTAAVVFALRRRRGQEHREAAEPANLADPAASTRSTGPDGSSD